jgi:hypothetical protein
MEITREDVKIRQWIKQVSNSGISRGELKDNRPFWHQWGPLIMKKANISKLIVNGVEVTTIEKVIDKIKYHTQLREDLKSKLNDEDFIKNVKSNILYEERYRLADVESLDIEQYVEFKIKELEEILSWLT